MKTQPARRARRPAPAGKARSGAAQKRRRKKWSWRRRLEVAGVVLLALLVVGLVPPLRRAAALVASKVILFVASPLSPDIAGFDELPASTKVLAADGSQLGELDGSQRREPVRLKALPEHIPRSVLAAEDARFYEHSGVDPSAVIRAALRNAQGGSQGGSTITQQLAKLNYTGGEKTYLRKLREVLYASRLENRYSKDELLERYLNQVYLGQGAYGITAAAKTYFGVAPEQLTVNQAALLAGLIKSPGSLDPWARPPQVTSRRNYVLDRMEANRWLTEKQAAAERKAPLGVQAAPTAAASRAPHFLEYVKREAADLPALGGTPEARGKQLFTGGYTIQTTIDLKAYDAAVASATQTLGQPGDPTTAIASVQPGDGAIRVLFGGLDPNQRFDVSSQGHRQPGSAFKPFVYLAALRAGIDPRSTIDGSSPFKFTYRDEAFTVNNYEGEGGGPTSIDDALVQSINTAFMRLMLTDGVGPDNTLEIAESTGIPEDATLSRPAIALGGLTKGVSPLEMASAFATFAAKGNYTKPYAIVSIADRDGKEVYKHEAETASILDPKHVGVLNAQMLRVIQQGTGTAARAIGRPAAGKTGTTQNFGDAWFVGFVPQMSTAVWVGNPAKIEPMLNVHGRKVSGGSFPAAIWGQMMRDSLEGVKVEQIHTASPEGLGLKPLNAPPPPSSTSSSSTTTLPPVVDGYVPPPPPPPASGPPGRGGGGAPPPSETSTTSTTHRRGTTSTTSSSTSSTSSTSTTVKASGNDGD